MILHKITTSFVLGIMIASSSVQNMNAKQLTDKDFSKLYADRNQALDIEQEQWIEKYNKQQEKQKRYIGEFQLTFYTNSVSDCGKTDGITASRTRAKSGRTIAMDKRFPFGTEIEIEGFGTYIVEDRGGAIKGNIIDIFVDSQEEANKLGRIKNVKVYYAK